MADDELDLEDQIIEEAEPEEVEDEEVDGAEPALKDEDQESEPRQGRAQDRIRALRDETRRAQERADEFERELQRLRFEAQQRESQYSQVSEQERLSMMSPEERMEYQLQKVAQQQQEIERQFNLRTADQNDRTSFQQFVNQTPEFQKLAPQVENELQAIRRQMGINVPRQLVLATLLGMQVLQNGPRAAQGARKAAARNMTRQKTSPTGGQSDVAADRSKKGSTPRERLEGVTF